MNHFFPKDRRLLRLTTAAVGAALWGMLLIGFYALVHGPLQRLEESQVRRIDELQILLHDNENVHISHRTLRATLTEMQEQIDAVRRRIPTDSLEAIFLSDATSIAKQEGLQIEDFRRLAVENLADYSEVSVVVHGRGTYASICRFLHRVSQLDRLSTVRRLAIASDSAQPYPFEVVYSLQFGMRAANAQDGGAPR